MPGSFSLSSYVDFVLMWKSCFFEDGEDVNSTVVRRLLFAIRKVSNIGRNAYFVRNFLVITKVLLIL